MADLDVTPGAGMEPAVALVYGMVLAGRRGLLEVIRDLTPEQLAQRPAGFKNSIAALVVHVAGLEVGMAHQLQGRPMPDELKAEFLRDRPQNPIPQPEGETAASLTAKLEKARQYLEQGCRALTAADLDREVSVFGGRTATVRWMLGILPIHQAQHCGQAQMIRQHLA